MADSADSTTPPQPPARPVAPDEIARVQGMLKRLRSLEVPTTLLAHAEILPRADDRHRDVTEG